jgi:hypothetical protein
VLEAHKVTPQIVTCEIFYPLLRATRWEPQFLCRWLTQPILLNANLMLAKRQIDVRRRMTETQQQYGDGATEAMLALRVSRSLSRPALGFLRASPSTRLPASLVR